MNDENKPGAGTGAGNGNGVAKPTSYENLSTLDGHFNGIIEKLSATASHKATPAELKTESKATSPPPGCSAAASSASS